jgi:hypothetical protein
MRPSKKEPDASGDLFRARLDQIINMRHELGAARRCDRLGVDRRELSAFYREAIEAAIHHVKTDGHLGRDFLKGRDGDRANAVLTAAGDNLRLILNWLRLLSRKILKAPLTASPPAAERKSGLLTVNKLPSAEWGRAV